MIGALLVLGLFCKDEWGIDDCFPFSQRFTRPESISNRSIESSSFSISSQDTVSKPHKQFLYLIRRWKNRSLNSLHKSPITPALKEIFGQQGTLFSSSRNTKVAVTRVDKDFRNYTFTNFNGPEERPGIYGRVLYSPEQMSF
jgi:hypothetical protein